LANAPPPASELEASVRGVEAATLARLRRDSEAESALRKARAALDRLPRPGRILEPDPFGWYEAVRAEILIAEAAGLIPKAPVVPSVGSLARDVAARRERKVRAVHLSGRESLALIRLDLGQRDEAEAEFRAVLAERVKIAAEEPANSDFQADLAATNQQLGRLLAEGGKGDKN
jgi:hypothetical protein